MIALNAESKIDRVAELLAQHRTDPAIVFAEHVATVEAIGRRLALPTITYRTPPDERRLVLERFRSGRYTKLAAGRVLNEGVDVPDARVAIVVSGSAATREYIQRLGRVLRPKPGEAILYELISRRTTEGKAARRRNPGAMSPSPPYPLSRAARGGSGVHGLSHPEPSTRRLSCRSRSRTSDSPPAATATAIRCCTRAC